MKIKHLTLAVLIVSLFTFTQITTTQAASPLDTISIQLKSLYESLSKLLITKAEVKEVTSATNALIPAPRTCQVNLNSLVNGVRATSTVTIRGSATDVFAIGFSVGTSTKTLPFTEQVQSVTWGKTKITGTTGYFTPEQYTKYKTELGTFAGDRHYKILPISLANINSVHSSTTYSVENPFAEGQITNLAGAGIVAGKVTLIVNVTNCTPSGTPGTIQDPKKPNIVFVLADDLDLATMAELPKLKALMANKGMTFENQFVSLSACCPSRAAALTGTYAHNNGVFTNNANNADGTSGGYKAFSQFGNEDKTLAVWLQNAGYKTALMGKYLNGYSADVGVPYTVPAGWSEWAVPLDGNPYSQYNYTLNVNGKPEEHYLSYCTKKGDGKNCLVDTTASTLAERQANFLSTVLNKKAKDFITRSGQESKPFFLYLAPFTPHSPSTPAPKYESLLTDATWLAKHPLKKTASFNEVDISDKPAWLKNNAGLLGPKNIATLEKLYQKRLISMYTIEDMLAELIETLTKNGQIDNTYIVFTSDNGFHLGQHRLLQGKQTGFDTDLRVPLIIRGPNVAAGSVTKQLTANIDIAPTFASLANVPVPSSVDGRSFKETLLGGTSVARNAILLEHAEPATPAVIQALQSRTDEPRDTDVQNSPLTATDYVGTYSGVRTAQYTYIRYLKNNEEELYDNTNDPEQLTNVASVAGVGLLNKLRNWTTDLSTCKGVGCRTIDSQNRLAGEAGGLDGKACFYNNQQINNGSSRTFYSKRTVEPGMSCASYKQVRSCTDGKLSGDETYNIDSCTVLERFTGVNFNRQPEDLNLTLMNQAGATWMRANADIVTYAASSTYNFANWSKFKVAHKAGKKGIVNLMWDFERYDQSIPLANSAREKELFDYLDNRLLPELLPVADIIVSGNEPFVNTLDADWAYNATLKGAPLSEFYKRVTQHLQDYMVAQNVRTQHKLYVGAFTRLYDTTMQTGKASYAVQDLLKYANATPFVDGIDIHTHVGVKALFEVESSLKFATKYTNKPITNTEYTYVHAQADHVAETLDFGDARNLDGKSFVEKYPLYLGTMTVTEYMKKAVKKPVTKQEWDDFFRSRTWTVDHFILKANNIFKKYAVNGATFGFIQTNVNFNNDLPWYMNSLYTATTMQHLPPTPEFPNGQPQGNYQFLDDFKSLQVK